MKGKKFYFILIGLIAVGIGSIFLFRQQQESRFMEFEGYEIREIEARVDALYNEDKSDILENISEEELTEIDDEIADLREQDFSKRNERRLDDVELDYLIARELNAIQLDIDQLFIEDNIVDKEITVAQIDGLEQQVLEFEIKEGFAERNMNALDCARNQMIDIEVATEYVAGLFDEEDVVRNDITREEQEKALELIEPIRNEDIKEELLGRVEVVSLTLTEMEEALALEEELEALEEEAEEDEELEEVDTEYSAPASGGDSGSSSNSTSPRPGNNSSSTNNSGGSGDSGSQEQSGNTNDSGGSSESENGDSDTEEQGTSDEEEDLEERDETPAEPDSETEAEPEPEPAESEPAEPDNSNEE